MQDLELRPGLRLAGRGIPGLNFQGLSRGLKIFRDTVPVPGRSLVGFALSLSGRVTVRVMVTVTVTVRDMVTVR